ncbi:MAG: DUF4157 domain-containing protein, partial [Pseudoxanthomonas sp.]
PASPRQRMGNAIAHAVVVQRGGTGIQASGPVSSPHDRAEVEATQIARTVVNMSAPAPAGTKTQSSPRSVQRAPAGPKAPPPVAAPVASIAGGAPLPASVRGFMEPRFAANFGQVRIHTGEQAARQSAALNAHAFTVGQHVFFGRNQYQPDSPAGKELIAHELTHTIQQGGAIQRSADTAVAQRAPPMAQRLGIGDALDWFADKANFIPGFRLLTIVIGLNPINMSAVDRSAANLLRALLEMIPVTGKLIGDALESHGILAKVGNWVEAQVRTLGLVGGALRGALDAFLNGLSWSDIFDLDGVWQRAKRIFTEPIARLIEFGKSLAGQIIEFIREAILLPLAALAENTRGYDLLKAVLQKDPVTGQPFPRTPDTLIGGFMKLIGQEEVWENIKKANALPRAWAWFQGALGALMGFVSQLPTLFVNAFKSLELIDLVLVPKAFAKIAGVFGGFLAEFLSWAGNAVWNLLEIVFSAVAPNVLTYLKKTGQALQGILKNPMPFVGNLVRAAKLGFQNFGANLGTHLKAGLIDWLTGSLPGIYIPKAFSLLEIVKFALSVLGLTWANIRAKLVKVIGEPAVKVLETGFEIVVKLVTEGPAAAWELIKEQLANLKDMVIGGITDFIVDMVVQKAIPKLIAMFIPGAGFISAIVSIYDTIMVFVDKIAKIIQVVTSFVDSIVAIAGGAIDSAAKRVESTLAGLLSLAISFFAGFAGLGKVADKIMGVIAKVRAPIDKALDWLIGWIVKTAKAVASKLFGKDKKDDRTDAQKKADVHAANLDAKKAMKAKDATPESVSKALPGIQKKYRLTSIALVKVKESGDKATYHVAVKINPAEDTDDVELVTSATPTYKVEWSVDKSGKTVACKATLTEVHTGGTRTSAEKSAQLKSGKSGQKGDQGGHIIGHRFIGAHGIINMFPQNARFNVSAWKIMENSWAREIGNGFTVEAAISFADWVGVRPSTIVVAWNTRDPGTGKVVDKYNENFTNTAHQT